MKKSAIIALTGVLMLAFMLTNIGTVSAFRINHPSIPDPTATFEQGNPQFKAEILPTTQLAGLDSLTNGMLVPVGFAKGEKQFEGKALQLSGLSKTTVKLCFPISGSSSGWGGQVGYWNGSAWKLLPTSITPANESSLSWACALATENGQYTFLKWVVDTSLLPKTVKPACAFTIEHVNPVIASDPEYVDGRTILADVVQFEFLSSEDLSARNVKITYLLSDPIGSLLINGHSSNFVIANSTITTSEDPGYFLINTVSPLEISSTRDREFDKFSFDFGDCALTVTMRRAK